MVGVGGVLYDPGGFGGVTAVGDILDGWEKGTSDPCGSLHHFLQGLLF